MTSRGLRGNSSNYEARKTAFPHMRINESVGLISWKSKPQFFSSDEREKREFLGAIVGIWAKIHGLSFGPVRGHRMDWGETSSWWRSQFKISLARNECMIVWGGTPPLTWWMALSAYSGNENNLPGNSIDGDVPHECARRNETRKYLRKSCYRIKCTATAFLATFMWRRPLNSATSTTITHKKPKKVSDGTGTQVRA